MSLASGSHRVESSAGKGDGALGVSQEALDIYHAAEVIDLHFDSFLWVRMLGYDLARAHPPGALGGRFLGQVDLPRVRSAGISSATWVITTNIARPAAFRFAALLKNLTQLREALERSGNQVSVVRDALEYQAARARGHHAAFLGIQGGNALDGERDSVERLPEGLVLRITLLHLTPSRIGVTSVPWGKRSSEGLSAYGKQLVERLNARRILVDLAHVNRRGFFDALEVHARHLPPIVTHTGVQGVYPIWRNLDDEQLHAIADRGGVIGVMFEKRFLGPSPEQVRASTVVDHMEHILRVVGDDFVALGSDWDGAIIPPPDLEDCTTLPRLVQEMLQRRWSAERIQKILGQNFLRVLRHARPGG